MKTKKNYTKKEKAEYFKNLRDQWNKCKELSEDEKTLAKSLVMSGIQSVTSYIFVLRQMREQGLDGVPYVDCKTFHGWKESGFKVNKGEKSKIDGLTWLSVFKTNESEPEIDKANFIMPKVYHLFHRSQVSEA